MRLFICHFFWRFYLALAAFGFVVAFVFVFVFILCGIFIWILFTGRGNALLLLWPINSQRTSRKCQTPLLPSPLSLLLSLSAFHTICQHLAVKFCVRIFCYCFSLCICICVYIYVCMYVFLRPAVKSIVKARKKPLLFIHCYCCCFPKKNIFLLRCCCVGSCLLLCFVT